MFFVCEGNESGVLKTKRSARASLFCASKRRHIRASASTAEQAVPARWWHRPPPCPESCIFGVND